MKKILLLLSFTMLLMHSSKIMAINNTEPFTLDAGINSLVVMPETTHIVSVNEDISA
jgi:hypothetical protein